MDQFTTCGFMPVEKDRLLAYVRKGSSQRAIVFIAGFNQPAQSWLSTIEEVDRKHTIAVIVRRQEYRKPNRLLGLQSIAQQQKEVVNIILRLKQSELIGLRLTIVGHSVGAMLARHCLTHQQIRDNTDRLVQIAPAPLTWWQFASHLAFWLRGGLLAAPFALLALLGITKGFSPPRLSVRGLFSGTIGQNEFKDYCWSLVPDSALVFLQLVIWYNGTNEWQKIRATWKGKNLIIGSPTDPTISSQAVKRLWVANQTTQDDLYWFTPNTPHCFWLRKGLATSGNFARLRALIEG